MANNNAALFAEANAARRSESAQAKVPAAQRAIHVIKVTPARDAKDARHQNQYLAVLRMRTLRPEATLSQLAHTMRISKDTYASRLRRALAYAETRDDRG